MKHLKIYEDYRDFLYAVGDFVIVNYSIWNLSKRTKDKVQVLVYVNYVYDFVKTEKLYGGFILPKKDDDTEIKFKEEDVIEKVPLEEVEVYLNTLKYNI